tara:strand:+ start:461 stop:1090 length:630 start_codon:yes stop_codon:yes gene_type:complete
MQIKICGIKDINSGEASVINGANYLGFNFIKSSKRVVSPDNSLNIINNLRKKFPKKKFKCVGLFDKEIFNSIEEISEYSKLDFVQICGDGDIDTPVPSMKQIRIKVEDNNELITKKIQDSLMIHNYVILDTYKENALGGTGEKFDWNKFRNSINTTNVFSSGGLNPENISGLLKNFKPFGIDIASGVETNGKKDPEKIKKIIKLSKEYS